MRCTYITPDTLEPCALGVGNEPQHTKPGKTFCPAHVAISFGERYCTHIKGKWAGTPFKFLRWQRQTFEKAYGTLKPDGTRQYRYIWVEIPKKNGKSELASIAALIGLVGDGEQAGEVYSAAGDKEQASLVYYSAAQMVRNNATLTKRLKIIDSRKRIIDYKTNSFYQVLSSESFTKHGINPSTIAFDEIHAQKNRDLWDVLTEGTDIARQQQLIWILTTAGIHDPNHIAYELHEYARQVESGVIHDPSWLSIIYNTPPDANWNDEKNWTAANPSINEIFDIDNLRTHYNQCKGNPQRENNFRRFRLNQWVTNATRYIDMGEWDKCNAPINMQDLLKRDCYGGLDLSSRVDMSSFTLVFPPTEPKGEYIILVKYYVPEDTLEDRKKDDRIPIDMWVRAGRITATPGNVIDYEYIRKDILQAANLYNIKEIAYDPWGATQLAVQLENLEGIIMVECRQGFKTMSEPTKELEVLVKEGRVCHGGHPVLRWNVDNLEVKVGELEDIRPVKPQTDSGRKYKRIDGIVAVIIALGRAITNRTKESVYTKRGIVSIGGGD